MAAQAVTVMAGVAVTVMAGIKPLGRRRAAAELVQANMVMVRESGPAQTQLRHSQVAAVTVSIGHSLANTTVAVVVAGGTAGWPVIITAPVVWVRKTLAVALAAAMFDQAA
jgi:hypothetical protein